MGGKASVTLISIHALREEGDLMVVSKENGRLFLSTPSARRATFTLSFSSEEPYISIHALREEGDGTATTLS